LKILIIGGQGMAGHMIQSYIGQATSHVVISTVRKKPTSPYTITLDVTDDKKVFDLIREIQPDVVINAVGILNEQAHIHLKEAIYVNSLFPQLLANYGHRLGFRLIHISTDCVFSGKKGEYIESDVADGMSIYAKTKSLGEVTDVSHLTIRTSIIGPEIKKDGIGLFHWFMQQSGEIRGYRKVFWNGVTTLELAKTILWCLDRDLTGLVHLAATQKISKYHLLQLFNEWFREPGEVQIQPYDDYDSDKSLVNTRRDFSYPVCDYPIMMAELKSWMYTQGGKYPYA
jgi:dTDP-4-dehydrorhamnose reductase